MKIKMNIYEQVTERIIEQLAKGIIPWHKPWKVTGDGGAVSYVTGRPYSFLNQMLLGRGGEYLTFSQAKKLGGHVKKGAQGGLVVFYSPSVIKVEVEDEDGVVTYEEREVPVLKAYHVFHVDDCEGIESKSEPVKGNDGNVPIERAEAIIDGYVQRSGVKFQNGRQSGQAYYLPSNDTVVVPMLSQYDIVEEYYSTAFHELVHSTGIKERLARQTSRKVAKGDDYSREELVAEIGSAMLCAETGIDNAKVFRNSVAYIQGWSRKLKEDSHAIVWAAGRAEKAAKYIINK